MDRFFDLDYFFNRMPGDPNLVFWRMVFTYAAITLIIAVIGVILQRRSKQDRLKRKLWLKWSTWGFSIGPVLLLLGFFRFQNAFFLSMRFLVFAWLAWSVVWALWIVRYWLFVLPKKIRIREQERTFTQYLPQKK